jgi:drug/metabolite transporter (DMT)-like permease
LFWSVEQIISKKAVAHISPRLVALGRMGFGAIFILLFLLLTNQLSFAATLGLKQFAWIGVSSVFLFSYVVTWYAGIKYVPVSQAAAILTLGAPITCVLQTLQGKSFLISQHWGIGLMLCGALIIFVADLFRKDNVHFKDSL